MKAKRKLSPREANKEQWLAVFIGIGIGAIVAALILELELFRMLPI